MTRYEHCDWKDEDDLLLITWNCDQQLAAVLGYNFTIARLYALAKAILECAREMELSEMGPINLTMTENEYLKEQEEERKEDATYCD